MAQSTALFRIGTRGSPLALVQARTVRARLAGALGAKDEEIELVIIRTSGDIIQDRPLAEEGGKGLFTKEIEEALLDGRVDLAVHSAKDMPTLFASRIDAGGLPGARGPARRVHQPESAHRSPSCRKAPRSAPPRCGGRPLPSGCGRTCR